LTDIQKADPKVYCFFPDDELLDDAKYFTSWIRQRLITTIKVQHCLNENKEQKRWKNNWLLLDYYEYGTDRQKNKVYRKVRQEFTEKIEEEDQKAQKLTLPEEFQYKWLDFLAEKNLTDYFLSN